MYILKKDDIYPDLIPLIPGSSWNQLFTLLYTLASVRYAAFPQLNSLNPKIGTKNKLALLAKQGYIAQTDGGAYITADKGFDLLKKEGFNTQILDKNLTGNYSPHQAVALFNPSLSETQANMLKCFKYIYLFHHKPENILIRLAQYSYVKYSPQ